MSQAVRQLVSSDSANWLTLEDAAKLTGESIRTWRWRASRETREAGKEHRRSLVTKAPSRNGRGKHVWWVHRSFHHRLAYAADRGSRDGRACAPLLSRYPQHQVERAYRKARWLQEWRRLCHTSQAPGVTDRELAEQIAEQAKALEGNDLRISVRSLQDWWRAYNAIGTDGQVRGVEGLIDRRGNAAPSSSAAHRSPEAIAYFYELFHTQNCHTIRTCHKATFRKAQREGWAWAASYSATLTWLQTHDDLAISYLMRQGKDAFARRYLPHLEVDYSSIQPGELYVCDHTQCDFWIEDHGKQLRPWLTAIVDCKSRCVVGWNLGVSPHQDAILSALRMAFRDWAIPTSMRIDNGKDFTSELLTGVTKRTRDRLRKELGRDWQRVLKRDADLVDCVDPRWTGIINELGVELIYSIPYSPWSKGIVERWYGTFHDQCGKTFATYCGNSVLTKPECLEQIRRGYTKQQKHRLRQRYGRQWKKHAALRLIDQSAVPTLEQARQAVGEYLTVYHHAAHSGLGGLSPQAVWSTATTIRQAVKDELLLLCEGRGAYKVGANGVAFTVGSHRLTYGAQCSALDRYRGRKVFITLDPDDVSQCYAWTAGRENRRLIARLESNDRIAPNATVDKLREAIAKVNHRRKFIAKAERSAAQRTRTATQELRTMQREQAAELRATGTDAADRQPNVKPVHTGFEGASKQLQQAQQKPKRDRKRSDLQAASKAIFGRPWSGPTKHKRKRPSDDLLHTVARGPNPEAVTDDGDSGKDAGDDATDPFRWLGDRHERADE